jgi:hypothetical protein
VPFVKLVRGETRHDSGGEGESRIAVSIVSKQVDEYAMWRKFHVTPDGYDHCFD